MEIESIDYEDDAYETNMRGFFVLGAISKNSAIEAILKELYNYKDVPINAVVLWYEGIEDTTYRVSWLENKLPIGLRGDEWAYLKDFCLYQPTE